jgi:hypothetical protein
MDYILHVSMGLLWDWICLGIFTYGEGMEIPCDWETCVWMLGLVKFLLGHHDFWASVFGSAVHGLMFVVVIRSCICTST